MTRVIAAAALLAGCSSSTFTWELHLGVASTDYEVRVDGTTLPADPDALGYLYSRDYADRAEALAAPDTTFDVYQSGTPRSQLALHPSCDDGTTAACGVVVLERDTVVIDQNGQLAPLTGSASCYDGGAESCGGWISAPPLP